MKKKVLFIITLITLIVALSFGIIAVSKKLNHKKNNQDAIDFKNEYEELNGKQNGKFKYQTLSIDKDNPIVYATVDEIIDILNKKTGVIYFGFPNCPWCRNAVPVLLESAKENGVDKIYYLNILDIRDEYKIKDGELVKTKYSTKNYNALLESLDEILEEYVVEGIETGEKRLYAPTVVFVKSGSIVGYHVDTVKLEENQTPYDALTKEQIKELKGTYNYYMEQTFNDYCDDAC